MRLVNNNRFTIWATAALFISMLGLFCLPILSFADVIQAKQNIVLDGKTLKVLINGKYKILKRGDFYGYGWLDDHRIFIAYQQEGWSEAIVNAEVVDLRKSKVIKLGTIMEANGESNFAVNSKTNEVVFNGAAKARDGSEEYIGVIKLMIFDKNSEHYESKTIKNKIDCTNVLWVDNDTIGTTLYDGHNTYITISVH